MDAKDQFLDSLVKRDFARLQATLAPGVQARFLLPHGLEEYADAESVTRRIASWFASASTFELTSSSAATVGPRERLSWCFDVVRQAGHPEVVEQVAFLTVGPTGIERLDLVCSGFQAAAAPTECAVHLFDAGTMGCADGLAEEFRRQLTDVPVGDRLTVVVRDPAAKEDLPALARLLGQSVTSVEAQPDGRLAINVERIK
jgi:TusA-related sulfurtransferase